MQFYQVALSLFFVINALGNIPLFIGLLSKYPAKRQRKIIIRELLIALGILLIFNFFGDELLHALGVSQPIIGIAGGVLLFIIALGMIFPKSGPHKAPTQEPMIVPLAMPLIAGPGAIASVMVYSEQMQSPWLTMSAIILAWIPSALILFSASNIRRILGEKGLVACERLGGMLICLIAVKIFTCGLFALIHKNFPPLP
jgi:multiple antibiotic resistance protein